MDYKLFDVNLVLTKSANMSRILSFSLVVLIFSVNFVSGSLSCLGRILYCMRESNDCILTCRQHMNVSLIESTDTCSDTNTYIDENEFNNTFILNTTETGQFMFSCCQNKRRLCSTTVIIYEEPVVADSISCIFEVFQTESIVTSVCTVQQNGTYNISVDISNKIRHRDKYKRECVKEQSNTFRCAIQNEASLDKPHTLLITTSTLLGNHESVTKLVRIIPNKYIKHQKLQIQNLISKPTYVNMTLDRPDDDYIGDICAFNCIWEYYIELENKIDIVNRHMTNTSSKLSKEIQIMNLRPNTHYDGDITWRLMGDTVWSHVLKFDFGTPIGVPKMAPKLVNFATGNGYVAVYIQSQAEDEYYGPITNIVVNKTELSSKDSRLYKRSHVETVSEMYNMTVIILQDDQQQNITLQYATQAGVSQNFSKMSIPPTAENNIKLRSLHMEHFNETHDRLTVDDIYTTSKVLYIYWCYGHYLTEKQLVECVSSIESRSISPPTKSILQRRVDSTELLDRTCPDCKLFYAAALDNDSMLWAGTPGSVIQTVLQSDTDNSIAWIILGVSLGVLLLSMLIIYIVKAVRSEDQPISLPFKADQIDKNTPVSSTKYYSIDNPVEKEIKRSSSFGEARSASCSSPLMIICDDKSTLTSSGSTLAISNSGSSATNDSTV